MVKGNPKSSASSGTRKKHAKKHQHDVPEDVSSPPPKGGKGLKKNKEPKVKMYIPPIKPAPVQPDPLETTGLGRTLPPELAVLLRSLAKKASLTKTRALEDLQNSWIDQCKGDERDVKIWALVEMVPVWLHHIPTLFISPSRRVRLLAANANAALLAISEVGQRIVDFLSHTASETQGENILGTWLLAANDVDRQVSSIAKKSWDQFVVVVRPASGEKLDPAQASETKIAVDATTLSSINAFVQRAALDPSGIYFYFNPIAPSVPLSIVHPSQNKKGGSTPSTQNKRKGSIVGKGADKGASTLQSYAATPRSTGGDETPRTPGSSKGDEQEESEADRKARLRIGALGGAKWLLGIAATAHVASESSEDIYANPALWTSLNILPRSPWLEDSDIESFGYAQPGVRKAAWGLVLALVTSTKETLPADVQSTLGIAILRSAWIETDTLVQAAMWQPLLVFVQKYPQSWLQKVDTLMATTAGNAEDHAEDRDVQDTEGDDAEARAPNTPLEQVKEHPNEPSGPQAYLEYLDFLASGCQGSPIQGFPTVVLVLSTIPNSILFTSPPTSGSSDPELPGSETPSDRPSIFFNSLWSALSSRPLSSLNRAKTHAALLSATLECLVFLVKKIRKLRQDISTANTTITPSLDDDFEERLVTGQLRKVWVELGCSNLRVDPQIAATQIASSIQKLFGVNDQLGGSAWGVITEQLKETARSQRQDVTAEGSKLVSKSLKVFTDTFSKEGPASGLKQDVESLLQEVLRVEVGRIQDVLVTSDRANGETTAHVQLDLLVDLTEEFKEDLWSSEESTSILDALLATHAYTLLKSSNLGLQLLLSYLSHRNDRTRCLSVWHALLSGLASTSSSAASSSTPPHASIDVQATKILLSVVQRNQIPTYLRPKADELDVLVGAQLQDVLGKPMAQRTAEDVAIVEGVLGAADYFISPDAYDSFLGIIAATSSSCVFKILKEGPEPETVAILDMATPMIQATFERLLSQSDAYGELLVKLLPSIFLHAYLVPSCMGSEETGDASLQSRTLPIAQSLWDEWARSSTVNPKLREDVVKDLKDNFKALVRDTQYHLFPRDILQLVAQSPLGAHVNFLMDVFPSPTELGAHLDSLFSDLIDPSAGVLDDTLPARSQSKSQLKPTTSLTVEYDRKGFYSYARVVDGISQLFLDDRQLAKQNPWALRHLVALSLYAVDLLDSGVSTSSWSPIFDVDVVRSEDLIELMGNIKKLSVYLVNSLAEHGSLWRKGVVDQFLHGEGRSEAFSPPQNLLWDLIEISRKNDTVRDTRVLKLVLESMLTSGYEDVLDANEGDQWVMLARKFEKTAPRTTISILSVLSSSGAEPPKLDRYRNELAASLLGIKPHSMSTTALISLRILAASAPPPDTDVVFLPTPRAVNVVKSLQSWVLAEGDDDDDEEMDEEIESTMLSIFAHLAPILQGVVGSHWPFVFDVLEGVLDRVCSEDIESQDPHGEEGSRLVSLARGLRLVVVLEDLSKRNKSLMDEWKDRRTNVLTMIMNSRVLLLDYPESLSAPLSAVRHLILTVLRNIPSNLIDEVTLPKMVHLLRDSSTQVQKTAYLILQKAAKKRTEHLVIEAGVDTEDVVKPILPVELVEIVMRDMWLEDDSEVGEHETNVFGYLLGWMLIFDSFADASFKVRSGYIQQLRDMNVVVEHFIPFLLKMLQLDQGVLSKAFKLGIWGVDAFYINLYEPGRPHSLPVLTAHIYYRALLTIPSLIYAWILDCKDRQLTNGVTTYTSIYFSPVLVKAELEHVRTHAVDDKLADESLSIKVTSTNPGGTGAAGIASKTNEVIAAYSVDEHQLEIRIRIPSDWPLHRAEVKDVKRVGVDENKWRAWVLGVQQTMWAHNGRIIDGLELFKKNVTLHFEGQVECAICYSIISVMDGSLPKKPCKTCKNRFHASCLYKWFNTSHSSSCPLCRSDII